jgi:hypothetical protein
LVKEDILVGWEEGEWEGPQITNSVIKSVSRRRRGEKASSCRKLNSPPLSTLFKRRRRTGFFLERGCAAFEPALCS